MKRALTLLLFVFFVYSAFAQDIAKQNYGHLSLEDGLSQGYITAIVQDKTGFMWFGTNDGLNRYDGYDFRKYYNKLNDINSISSNQITCISVDNIGRIWVGTNNGLNLYNANTDNFTRCKIVAGNKAHLSINCIQIDKGNNVWVTFVNDPYIHCYNPETQKTESFVIPQVAFNQQKNNFDKNRQSVSSWYFSVASDDNIYIGATNGTLIIFNPKNHMFNNVQLPAENSVVTSIVEMNKGQFYLGFSDGSLCSYNSLTGICGQMYILNPDFIKFTNTSVYCMVKGENNKLHIGTQGEGLFVFDINRNIFDQVLFVEPSDRNIISKGIYSLFFDKSGILWCGTNGYGIYNLSTKSSAFKTINQVFRYIKQKFISNNAEIYASFGQKEGNKSLIFQSIRGIYANDDFILVGGYNGLEKINRKTGDITTVSKEIVPYVICPDADEPEKYLWIGTESRLRILYRYNIITGALELQSLSSDYIFSIYPDKDNILWIGTRTGLYKYNKVTGKSIFYSNNTDDPNSIPSGPVRAVKRDKNGLLWIGTETGGISFYNEQNGEFVRFQNQQGNFNSLTCNNILFLDFDKNNNMLIGTAGGGINIFDNQRKSFLHITTINGLPNNVVYSVLEDNYGIFWISTNKGVCSLNPNNLTINCYYASDGIQGDEFNSGSYFKDKNGILFFGGVNGLTYFDPTNIKTNEYKPEVILTYIKQNNEEIKFNCPVNEIKEIVFEHDNNVFTIGFSALSFYQSNKNQYAYKLTGRDNKWIMLGTKHELSFHSLEEGNYTLEIIAANNDGVWNNKPLILAIRIKPPFYETWWFIMICIFIISGLVIGFVLYRISLAKSINKTLALQVEERTGEIIKQKLEIENQKTGLEEINIELHKVNNEKDKFFSIIAHDLKSPLNAILGFSRLLNEEFHVLSDENKKAFAGNIKDASEATYRLLENLLEWSRVQSSKIEIKPEIIDLGGIAAETLSLLHSSAEAKKISLTSSIDFNTTAYADENMVKTVFRNLVSNAIKFTQKGGEIKLSAINLTDFVQVIINDNGIGISEENLSTIFRLDVSIKSRGTANESGTGLGLIICKEFIERNGGSISVTSTIGVGSTFIFTLPKTNNHNTIK